MERDFWADYFDRAQAEMDAVNTGEGRRLEIIESEIDVLKEIEKWAAEDEEALARGRTD